MRSVAGRRSDGERAAGFPGNRDADSVVEDKITSHDSTSANPQVITPKDPRSPIHPASLLENIAPLPSIEAPPHPSA